VRHPRHLCILLPEDLTDFAIQPIADKDVVRILDEIGVDGSRDMEAEGSAIDFNNDPKDRNWDSALTDREGMAYDG
jgi:hypothetical protein